MNLSFGTKNLPPILIPNVLPKHFSCTAFSSCHLSLISTLCIITKRVGRLWDPDAEQIVMQLNAAFPIDWTPSIISTSVAKLLLWGCLQTQPRWKIVYYNQPPFLILRLSLPIVKYSSIIWFNSNLTTINAPRKPYAINSWTLQPAISVSSKLYLFCQCVSEPSLCQSKLEYCGSANQLKNDETEAWMDRMQQAHCNSYNRSILATFHGPSGPFVAIQTHTRDSRRDCTSRGQANAFYHPRSRCTCQ